jgi:hypothetical protein
MKTSTRAVDGFFGSSNLTSGWQTIYQSTRPLAPSLAMTELTSSQCVSGLKRTRGLSSDSEKLADGQRKDGHYPVDAAWHRSRDGT